jgi:hypothetical protein
MADQWTLARWTGMLAIVFAPTVGAAAIRAAAQSPIDLEFFESHVRPLLVAHCYECHDSLTQSAKLRLDSRESMLMGGKSGPAMVPGDPAHSLLLRAVKRSGELQMPPDDPLSNEQVAVLEEWIARGAPWPANEHNRGEARAEAQRTHWAFQPLTHPEPPLVQNVDLARTPIDAFVLAKLEQQALAFSTRADRRTLIRRVTYDLTGLPPTQAEVDSFVNDGSDDAYANIVERLLASPQYGEHWARHWLDIARYSDTKGYVYSREERFFVHASAYRDWVVDSFNRDLPYDKFLIMQLAADQAAPNDRHALAAMGYLTLGRRFLGVTPDIIDDRIDVVCRGMLGLTVGCARCHDHKYDPIPTEDYYSLYGVFLNCTERLSQVGDPPVRDQEYVAFENELHAREQKLKNAMAAARDAVAARVRGRIGDYLAALLHPEKFPDEKFDQILSAGDLIPASVRRWQMYLARTKESADPVFFAWHRFAALDTNEFAARAAEVSRELKALDSAAANSSICRAFLTPPSSMREVAQRYAALFAKIDGQWTQLKAQQPGAVALPDEDDEAVRQVLYAADSPCVVPDEAIVSTEGYFDTPTTESLWRLQGEVDRWLIQSPKAPPYAVALADRSWRQDARVFRRGNSSMKGDVAPPRFLKALSPPDRAVFTEGSGRLELARAITSEHNPLTARVWVNRVWMHHYGAGLVRTPSDFGLRAEPPSHPELLDWLASEFIAHGWSTKWLHRSIVTSAAYQQSSTSAGDAAYVERAERLDPENRFLWRGHVHRLSFEQYRDTILSVSGELDGTPGGRAKELFTDAGQNVRRTLYGLVDRQFLSGPMRTFDFANPDLHTPQRSETTVSQQALFAMNHPFMARGARSLEARITSSVSDRSPSQRIKALYQIVLQRDPTLSEAAAAKRFLDAPEECHRSVRPEMLAWTYGYGELNVSTGAVAFSSLPHFSGAAWQGGNQWPDAALGWVQLTAEGGHAGNDLKHAAIRRWTAPRKSTVSVASEAKHEVPQGDGVRCSIAVSRRGVLKSSVVHNERIELNVDAVEVEAGDAIDLITDYNADLNNEQFLWSARIRDVAHDLVVAAKANAGAAASQWSSRENFGGEMPDPLSRWQQLAQVLLMSNEVMFID